MSIEIQSNVFYGAAVVQESLSGIAQCLLGDMSE